MKKERIIGIALGLAIAGTLYIIFNNAAAPDTNEPTKASAHTMANKCLEVEKLPADKNPTDLYVTGYNLNLYNEPMKIEHFLEGPQYGKMVTLLPSGTAVIKKDVKEAGYSWQDKQLWFEVDAPSINKRGWLYAGKGGQTDTLGHCMTLVPKLK